MNTLHTFGCSYTAYFENNNGRSQYEDYKKFRGGFYPKVWPELLSEKLGMNLNNTAIGGSSNYEIFQLFCESVPKLNEGDVVVIGWSYKERYRLVDETLGKFSRIGPQFYPFVPGVSKTTIEEISVNRMHIKWLDEVNSWEILIKKACDLMGVKLIIWSFDYSFPEHDGFYTDLKGLGAKTITEETNGIVKDEHFGEMGHFVQYQYLYDVICNNKTYNYIKKKLI